MNFKHSKGYTQVKDEKKPFENNGIKWDLPQISGQSLTDAGFLLVLGSKTSILFWWSGEIFYDIRPSVQKGSSIHHRQFYGDHSDQPAEVTRNGSSVRESYLCVLRALRLPGVHNTHNRCRTVRRKGILPKISQNGFNSA